MKTSPSSSIVMKKCFVRSVVFPALLVLGFAPLCAADGAEVKSVAVKEFFFTPPAPQENIDSPAVWHGPNGEHWHLATSKEGHSLNVDAAVNGSMLRRIGGLGSELGRFNRPDGVWLAQTPMPRFPLGAFYGADADAAVAAFSWAEVVEALGLAQPSP